jgi:phosphatidylserine/phosphatidylglycerophosphate/cardiolipin synthase-like enzyme
MKLMTLFLLSILITTSAWGSVKAYFNQNSSKSYIDPYRKMSRTGDNLEAVVLDGISKARKTIFVAVQELRLPLIAQALVAKKKAGVDVRVVLENDYNFTVVTGRDRSEGEHEATKLNELKALVDVNRDGKFSKEELETRDAVHILKVGGVPVIDDTSDNSSGSGLMHHKFVIIDGKTTIVSTANFTLSCIHGDLLTPSSRGNANSMTVINSTAAADIFEEEFLQMWGNGKRGNFGHNKTYRGAQTINVSGTRITIQFSPTSRRYTWEESTNGLIGQAIAAAKSTVAAALFVFSDQKLANVLEKRGQAGVRMGVLVEAKFAWRDYSELLDMAGVKMLNHKCTYEPDNRPWKKPAVEIGTVGLTPGDVLHHKFAVIDSKMVVVGSQNWSDAANYVNDEFAMVIENSTIAGQYTQEYMSLRKRARLGVPNTVATEIKRLETACSGRGIISN